MLTVRVVKGEAVKTMTVPAFLGAGVVAPTAMYVEEAILRFNKLHAAEGECAALVKVLPVLH